MKTLVVVCALVAAATASYSELENGKFYGFGHYYYPVGHHKINQNCDAIGRYLPHPTDRCLYLRCGYGKEPWYDLDGNIRFYALPFNCPAGTSVSRSRYPQGNDPHYNPAFGPHEHPCVPEEGLSCPGN